MTTSVLSSDVETLKTRLKTVWMAGNYNHSQQGGGTTTTILDLGNERSNRTERSLRSRAGLCLSIIQPEHQAQVSLS